MNNSIEILSPITEWTVFQKTDGFAEIHLHGIFSVSDKDNYPVIKAVTVNEETVVYSKVNTKNSEWNFDLKLPVGMYRIETGIALKETGFNPIYLARGQIIRNIFVGENFIIAGQSNAVGFGKEKVCDSPKYGVCMYNGKWNIASHPIGHMNDKMANADYLNSGHSAWLNFGKLILNNQNTPTGLIPTALGGSPISEWAEDKPLFQNTVRLAKLSKAKNLIWYQGCSDVFGDMPEYYEQRLYKLISAFKRLLGDINIYIVQISGTTNITNPDSGWRKIREIQRKIACRTNAYLIPTYDLIGFSDDIHLGSKDNIKLSERVYKVYLNKTAPVDIGCEKTVNGYELKFNGVSGIDNKTAKNIVALDCNNDTVKSIIATDKNKVRISADNVNHIKYITLPFGRLYDNSPLYDDSGNLIPYFCIDVKSICHKAL